MLFRSAAAMRAVLQAVFDSAEFVGRSIMIQGVGGVGEPLARRLAESGATLLLSDIDEVRVTALAKELGASSVPATDVYDTECDIYAPCALGATLNEETIPRLRCRAAVGSANNQLAGDADADLLHERGILYAPDFIANGGGALAFALINSGMTDEARLARRLDGIETALSDLFREASDGGESPHRVAIRRIQAALNRG